MKSKRRGAKRHRQAPAAPLREGSLGLPQGEEAGGIGGDRVKTLQRCE